MSKFILLTVAMLIAVPVAAYAGSEVNCSGVAKNSSDRTYKKGARVWSQDTSGNYYVYSCQKDQCVGSALLDGSVWKVVGSRVSSSGDGACH